MWPAASRIVCYVAHGDRKVGWHWSRPKHTPTTTVIITITIIILIMSDNNDYFCA